MHYNKSVPLPVRNMKVNLDEVLGQLNADLQVV